MGFVSEDLPKVLDSMQIGTERIRQIVQSLQNFSRIDQSEMKSVDIHEGIDSTLMILQHRLKANVEHSGVQVFKEYADLPLIECYPGQLNQVFMNLLSNAIDAMEVRKAKRALQDLQANPSVIRIQTQLLDGDRIAIYIADNGIGMPEEVRYRIFDPFFTTKANGKGTGLGLSISYQIVVEKHGGEIKCIAAPGQGTKFIIEIPTKQTALVRQ